MRGENCIGSNNYEHLAQLNSQIEIKHIAIQNNNKSIVKYPQDNLFFVLRSLKGFYKLMDQNVTT